MAQEMCSTEEWYLIHDSRKPTGISVKYTA
uniref:Uncharacterized protein n=1 Tax=Arundo donax TaxID=35708 RepID=A0A0A8Z1Q8_ARUDO